MEIYEETQEFLLLVRRLKNQQCPKCGKNPMRWYRAGFSSSWHEAEYGRCECTRFGTISPPDPNLIVSKLMDIIEQELE